MAKSAACLVLLAADISCALALQVSDSKALVGEPVATGSAALTGPAMPPSYKIGTWQGFRQAAVSYTFDDGYVNQFEIAAPMFTAKGFNMTFFLITAWISDWDQIRRLASAGHEIGSHTVTHPDLSTLSDTLQAEELALSQQTIAMHLPGPGCLTLAYPVCSPAKEAIASQYYIAARTCSGAIESSTPKDFLLINSIFAGMAPGHLHTVQDFTNKANRAAVTGGWCVYLFHDIGKNGVFEVPTETLSATLDFFDVNRDRFWVQTFGNVVRYIMERNAATVVEVTNQDHSFTVRVSTGLDHSIFNYPITLRRILPVNWAAVTVLQNNAPVESHYVRVGSTNYVMFDVVPDGGDVVIQGTPFGFSVSNYSDPNYLQFNLQGPTGLRYAIEGSSNLVNWSRLQTNVLTSSPTNLIFNIRESRQFYRVQLEP